MQTTLRTRTLCNGPSSVGENDGIVVNSDRSPVLNLEDPEVTKLKVSVLISRFMLPESKEKETFPKF